MVHKMLFWSTFGILTRLMQLGMEKRPLFYKQGLWVYPWYASVGGAFGYWLIGVEDRQIALLTTRRDELLERRQKRKARERVEREESGVEAVS